MVLVCTVKHSHTTLRWKKIQESNFLHPIYKLSLGRFLHGKVSKRLAGFWIFGFFVDHLILFKISTKVFFHSGPRPVVFFGAHGQTQSCEREMVQESKNPISCIPFSNFLPRQPSPGFWIFGFLLPALHFLFFPFKVYGGFFHFRSYSQSAAPI